MLEPEPLPDAPEPLPDCTYWSSLRVWCWELCSLPSPAAPHYRKALWFDRALTLSLVINVGFLMCQHHPSSSGFNSFYETQNIMFLVLYWLEALLRVLGLGKQYFTNKWYWL